MKTLKKLLPFVVIGLVLTGCGSNNQKDNSQSSNASQPQTSRSTKSASNSKPSVKTKSSSSSNSGASDMADSKNTSQSNSSQVSSETSMKPVMKKSNPKKTSRAIAKKVSGGEAGFDTKNYGSSESAAQQINYQGNMGGQPINLGYNVKGTQDAGAGQVYVHFNMGNWSVTTHGNNVNTNGKSNAVPVAKYAVKYLQSHTLPYPNKRGAIQLQADNGEGATTIKWQDNNKVNTITNIDAKTALAKATALQK